MTRVLHLFSNRKWTGPADHALNLVSWLSAHPDYQIIFACGRRRGLANHILNKANERQIRYIDDFLLNKHLNWRIIPDIFSLKKVVAREGINIIHSHQDNDALTAVLAGFGHMLVRTCYEGQPFRLSLRRRFILQNTARIMVASSRVQRYLSSVFPEKWIEKVDIPVDLEKFRPAPKSEQLRLEFGLTTDDPVAGIVARVQKHRDFPLLISAVEEVVREIPQFKLLIVGRGTHIDMIARKPVIKKGLQKNVIFTGYRDKDYQDVLNLFDFKIFIHPGSDGSCRAVREALASGKPVVATRGGILPELIIDGETGLLVDDKPRDLAKAIKTMFRETEKRIRFSHAARRYAENALNYKRYVEKVLVCYKTISYGGAQTT